MRLYNAKLSATATKGYSKGVTDSGGTDKAHIEQGYCWSHRAHFPVPVLKTGAAKQRQTNIRSQFHLRGGMMENVKI